MRLTKEEISFFEILSILEKLSIIENRLDMETSKRNKK